MCGRWIKSFILNKFKDKRSDAVGQTVAASVSRSGNW